MTFASILDGMAGKRALVIGDLMLDEYIFGSATRISPEAPVMVIRHSSSRQVPGGAANVARNMQSFGAIVALVGLVGNDESGRFLSKELGESGSVSGLVVDENRMTTRKTRVVAEHSHQVLRIDAESDEPISESVENRLMEAIRNAASEVEVVVLSDYRKGALTASVVAKAIAVGKELGIPVLANPKPQTLSRYKGASLVSLNRSEAGLAVGQERPPVSSDAYRVASQIRNDGMFDVVLVTLGEDGAIIASPDEIRISAPRVEVADPAGAGDTVIAATALGVSAFGFVPEVFQLAIELAASVVQHVGVAVPSEADLARIRSIVN
jgi:D-beta-D-heptose 7-phosphate kinase/D-beta-D-heptose 1-phosphate adenosyltransferase